MKFKKELLWHDLSHVTDKMMQTFVNTKSYEHNESVKQDAEGKITTFKQGSLHMTDKVQPLSNVLIVFNSSKKFMTCLNFIANMKNFDVELVLGSRSALGSKLRCNLATKLAMLS